MKGNGLFDEEIRGHHSMRDHLLTVISDEDLTFELPGRNPTLGEVLVGDRASPAYGAYP